MAKYKKNNQKKPRKRMSPETKDKLKTGFLTLVNNDACIKAGRSYRWFTPVILAICSVVLTLVPSFVNTMKVNMGESVIGNNVGAIENGLAAFQNTLKIANASVKINENGELAINEVKTDSIYNSGSTTDRYYEYKDSYTEEPVLRVLFSETDFKDLSDKNDYLKTLSKYDYYGKTTAVSGEGSSAEEVKDLIDSYRVSVLIFEKTKFIMGVYNRRISVSSSSCALNEYTYDYLKGKDLLSLCPESGSLSEDPSSYVASVKTNYQNFLTAGYETTKVQYAWRNAGILAGINAGVILLLGLVLFLITRGKRNPYRVVTFWQAQKIAYWAAPCPAILALGLGFMLSSMSAMSSMSMFVFLFLYGLRIMWTSMKAFSPQGK